MESLFVSFLWWNQATDEMEMDKYKKELAAWEKEKYRQKYEFCITENDLDADKRLTDDVEIVVSFFFKLHVE